MPTSPEAFAMVAHVIGNVSPDDEEAVNAFYLKDFSALPTRTRKLVSDFLVTLTGMPSRADLRSLQRAVSIEADYHAPMTTDQDDDPAKYGVIPDPHDQRRAIQEFSKGLMATGSDAEVAGETVSDPVAVSAPHT